MSWLELLLIPLGLSVGAYGTAVGSGGGFVLVPVLLFIFPDDSQKQITAISLAVILATSISGSIANVRSRLIDYRTGLAFAAAAVPASFAGAFVVRFLPRSAFDVTFGVLLAALAAYIVLGVDLGRASVRSPLREGPGVVVRTVGRGDGVVSRYAYDIRLGTGISGAVAFVATLFGVGGGIVQVPMMVSLLRIPIDISVATSQFMLVFIATSGASVHAASGSFGGEELRRAALLAAGAIVGAQIGALLSRRLAGQTIARLLAGGLIIVSARLILAPLF